MRPSLYWPIRFVSILQRFGQHPEYYNKFLDANGNPEQGHPGIDLETAPLHGMPVYAAHDGMGIYLRDDHGGEGIWIYAKGYATIYWHLIGNTDARFPLPIPFDNGYHAVTAGQLIGYADNTGAPYESTGPHLHFGLVLTDAQNQVTNRGNGYNGCIDPAPFMNQKYAQDIPAYIKLFGQLIPLLKNLISFQGRTINQ